MEVKEFLDLEGMRGGVNLEVGGMGKNDKIHITPKRKREKAYFQATFQIRGLLRKFHQLKLEHI